ASPGTPDDFRDRKLPAMPADQTAQKIRMAVRCRSCTHHNQGSPSNRSSRAGSVTSAAELALRCPVVIGPHERKNAPQIVIRLHHLPHGGHWADDVLHAL